MPDVMESPPARRHLPEVLKQFIFDDPEKARAAGQRSGEARRAKALARANKDKPLGPDSAQAEVNAQLELVAEQIARTRKVLNDDRLDWCDACMRGGCQPHHRAQLLKALDTMLDRRRKLLRISDPAPMKSGQRESRPQVSSDWEPKPAPAAVPLKSPSPAPADDPGI